MALNEKQILEKVNSRFVVSISSPRWLFSCRLQTKGKYASRLVL